MYKRIVVGVNQADTAARAASDALTLAELTGAEVHLVAAITDREGTAPLSQMVPGAALTGGEPRRDLPGHGDERRHADNFLARVGRDTTVATTRHVLPGDPAEVILQVAREVEADLIVVGNKGMQGVRRVLGSVPNTISHQADCSVLIVQTT